jgi:hypothetical protein
MFGPKKPLLTEDEIATMQRRLVQQAQEALQLELDSGSPSADAVAEAVTMVAAYVLRRPGCRQPQLEDMLKDALTAAHCAVDVVGIACTLCIVLRIVGDVPAAHRVLGEERIRAAYMDVQERILLAQALKVSLSRAPVAASSCPRCEESAETDCDSAAQELLCICRELKVKHDMDATGLWAWT